MKWWQTRNRDSDLERELRSDLELEEEEQRESGVSPDESRYAARRAFGNATLIREQTRAVWSRLWLESLARDLRYGVRSLCRTPGFTLTAIAVMALGIGANAAIFSVVNAVLRHPAGVDHPEQVAVLHTNYSKFTLDIPYVAPPTEAAALRTDLLETAALEQPASFNLLRGGRAEHVTAARVSAPWFRVFGAQPILGRTFTAAEDLPNTAPVVVLSYGFWQRAFGGADNVIGQALLLDGKSYRVLGVMRSDFAWPRRTDVWVPVALGPAAFSPDEFFNENYQAVVRLRPAIPVQTFSAALSTKMWDDLRPQAGFRYATSSGWSIYATSLSQFAAGPLRKPLYVLMTVAALVLLIAAANVAGLSLARCSARSKEFAIQMALGARTGQMIRQVFVETVLLALLACIAGAAAGPATGKALLRLVPNHLAAGFTVRMGPELIALAALGAVLTILISAFGPAYGMIRQRGQISLHEGETRVTASNQRKQLRNAFVIGEVAAAFLLLVGTGLFLGSLLALQRVDPGFNPRSVASAKTLYAGDDFMKSQPRQAAFVDGVVNRLAAQPQVRAAAAVQPLPFDPEDASSCSFAIVGRPLGPNDPGPHSQLSLATPGYLQVMQIPLIAGRWIAPADTAATERIAVIDARLARKYWPNQSPIGEHISFGCEGRNRPALIVGVVASVRLNSLEDDTSDGMRYYPFAQGTDYMADFLVRTDGNPLQMASLIKQAVTDADPSQAVSTVSSLETMVADSLAGRRLIVWMLGAFAALALLLAMIGVYGLISFLTAQRTREVGIRMALGAQRSYVLGLILRDALLRVGLGLSIGIGVSIGAVLILRHLFADFGAGGFAAFGGAALVLLLVGTIAGLIPALRAASVDPMKALRTE